MKNKIIGAIIGLFFFVNSNATVQYRTLTQLSLTCGTGNMTLANYCVSYLSGLHDAFVTTLPMVIELGTKKKLDMDCYQSTYQNVSMFQFSQMVGRYLSEHPELLDKPAGDVILGYWVKNYPYIQCVK